MEHIYNAEEQHFLNTIKKEILEKKKMGDMKKMNPSMKTIHHILNFSKAYESSPSKYVGRYNTMLN